LLANFNRLAIAFSENLVRLQRLQGRTNIAVREYQLQRGSTVVVAETVFCMGLMLFYVVPPSPSTRQEFRAAG
jgi:hypothetical protein